MGELNIGLKKRIYKDCLTTYFKNEQLELGQELKKRAPYLEHIVRRFIPKDHSIKILDLGCGYGAFLFCLKKNGYYNYEGIDISSEKIASAKELGLENVSVGDVLEKLENVQDSSYDVVISFDILEHFKKEDVFQVISEIYRILKAKGKLLLHVPNGEAIFSGAVFFSDLSHETCFTRHSIRQLISLVGFNSAIFVEDVPIVHGLKSFLRFVLWNILSTVFRLVYMAETGESWQEIILSQNLTALVEK